MIRAEFTNNRSLRGKWDKIVKQAAEAVVLDSKRFIFNLHSREDYAANQDRFGRAQQIEPQPEEEKKTVPERHTLRFKVKLTNELSKKVMDLNQERPQQAAESEQGKHTWVEKLEFKQNQQQREQI